MNEQAIISRMYQGEILHITTVVDVVLTVRIVGDEVVATSHEESTGKHRSTMHLPIADFKDIIPCFDYNRLTLLGGL